MANNFSSNVTRKLARVFLDKFESERVMSKNVNTQLLKGQFNPSSGDTVDFKRPTDYVSTRTASGDVSGGTATSIITGKATGTVQNYFTVEVDYTEADEAIKMDQLDELLAPAATRIVTDMEVDFAQYMLENAGLYAGTVGQAVNTWDEVADGGAVLAANGVPRDEMWCYAVNPYTQRALASNQRSLGTVAPLVREAHERAIISDNFAGLRVMTATTMGTIDQPAGADRAGVLASNPDVTYVTARDSMTQSLAISGMTNSMVIKAGSIVTVAGRYRLNQATRQPIIDDTGAQVLWSAVVTADVTLSGTGTGTLVVAGPAIYEATGSYNTVNSAPVSGDVVTVLHAASTLYQPNMFWHKNAFAIGSVPIKKLYSTDTIATTSDGLQLRVSKGASIRENKQIVRFDFRPAYATLNPFFAGQGYGTA